MIYSLLSILLFDGILHPWVFSEKNKFIDYKPHDIKDNVYSILPEINYSLEIMNNYYVLTVLSIPVLIVDLELLNAFILARLVRLVGIYLVQFPNPTYNSHLERNRTHDLIISGHTIQWSLIHIYIYNNYNIFINLATMCTLTLYYIHLIKKKHHYSIDIFLGLYVSLSCYFMVKLYVQSTGHFIFNNDIVTYLHLQMI